MNKKFIQRFFGKMSPGSAISAVVPGYKIFIYDIEKESFPI
jgi:hypothetical protein